jgi:excinuclease UvrABC nuclease subunit
LKKISSATIIIIDGRKGQLSAALKSIDELGLRGKIAVVVLQKTGGVILSWRFGSVIFR